MVGFCQRDDVGGVGVKLYYPDDTIQHAGIIVGIGGIAGNRFKSIPKDGHAYFAMESITAILAMIRNVKTSTNPNLEIEGFLFTMFDSTDQFQLQIATEIRNLFKTQVFSDYIPRNNSIPESQSKGIPVIMFRPNSIGAQAYLQVVKEIIQKNS